MLWDWIVAFVGLALGVGYAYLLISAAIVTVSMGGTL
jgi:hypothetical protein